MWPQTMEKPLKSEENPRSQVLERIKDPLQTQIARDHFETAYAVLSNFLLIVQRAPVIFSQAKTPTLLKIAQRIFANRNCKAHPA